TGKACAQTVLGIVNTGDASIDSAKKVVYIKYAILLFAPSC
ncbi:hypothetical protein GFK20_21720, partial [Salmonella enterica subsp. enterica serovar Enteritidis]|nr:hypothetical protein [Salmonella enterica subsp. enterica serovar Enteritidis]